MPLELEDLALIHGLTLRQYGEVSRAEVVVIDPDRFGLQAFVAFGFLAYNLLTWFQRDVFGDTGLGDLGLKRFMQDFMRLPAQVQKAGRTIRIKLMVAHAGAHALVAAIASLTAKKFGRQLGLPLSSGALASAAQNPRSIR